MVFIDAEKNEYMDYLRLVEGKLMKDSVVVADNVKSASTEMQDYLDHVRNSGIYSSSYIESENAFYPEGDAVEVSVKL
jgi:predicted O-methyltransferase YrrM